MRVRAICPSEVYGSPEAAPRPATRPRRSSSEKRRCPPGVRKERTWPASAQRRRVDSFTPSSLQAWPRVIQRVEKDSVLSRKRLTTGRTSITLPERSVGALFSRFYNVGLSAVKRRECSGSPSAIKGAASSAPTLAAEHPSAGAFEGCLRVRQQRRQHVHPRLQPLAQPAEEPGHTHDEQELPVY